VHQRPTGFRDFIAGHGFYSIYLVTTLRDAPVKIGIAQDPVRRLGALQNANFERLRIHRFWWVAGRPIAARVEQSFKSEFAPAAIRGEWFEAPLAAAEAFVESSIRSLGTWGISQDDMITFMEQWEQRRSERELEQIVPGRHLARYSRANWPVSRLSR
jgi:hypothetical protein